MGRSIPIASSYIPPALSITLLAAWIAATVTVITALCVSRHRKPAAGTKSRTKQAIGDTRVEDGNVELEATGTATPPPPVDTHVEKSPPINSISNSPNTGLPIAKSGSRRKLSASLSIRLPEGLTKIRTSKREVQKTDEETIWKKTIIMGERCQAPSDEEDEVVVYDENGHRQRNYHPKTPRSLPVSRRNSFAEPSFHLS